LEFEIVGGTRGTPDKGGISMSGLHEYFVEG